ncbi:unnamed protein product [Paramecium sonneborni]|uniref:Uncharacterized protein n=1 Tax=Paramecium sonneborni TaxID=65129 RepID=A0A8S1RKE8_9CILI|nr:unnamed protein product [Paramecium sonneborni]
MYKKTIEIKRRRKRQKRIKNNLLNVLQKDQQVQKQEECMKEFNFGQLLQQMVKIIFDRKYFKFNNYQMLNIQENNNRYIYFIQKICPISLQSIQLKKKTEIEQSCSEITQYGKYGKCQNLTLKNKSESNSCCKGQCQKNKKNLVIAELVCMMKRNRNIDVLVTPKGQEYDSQLCK